MKGNFVMRSTFLLRISGPISSEVVNFTKQWKHKVSPWDFQNHIINICLTPAKKGSYISKWHY